VHKIISPITRLAGEAQLSLSTGSDGIVKDAFFGTTFPIRAFESFAKGKNPYFVVEGVKRICGICHAVQGIAAAMAFEDALGVTVPAGGSLVRELCAIINRLQSHTLAQMMLTNDIFVPDKSAAIKMRLFQLYNNLCNAMEVVGGTPTHSPYVSIGGMQKGLTQKSFDKLNTLITRTEELLQEYSASLYTEEIMKEKYLRLKSAKARTPRLLATGILSGEQERIDVNLIDIVPNTSEESAFEVEASKSTSMAALYDKQMVEVGPRARMTLFKGFTGEGLAGLNEARVQEMLLCLEQIKEILKVVSPDGDTFMAEKLILKAGEGIGIYEAPRGVLIHSVKLGKNGRVINYRIIFPTMFNILPIQEAVKGLHSDLSETIVRLYDPCIPCEVH
jgi:coenzyme F420 hydrogenase subunit alpha